MLFFSDSALRLAIPDSQLSQLSLFRKYHAGMRMYSECDLNSNSNVFIIGGYRGKSAEVILRNLNSNITIFEPIKEFVEIMELKFLDSKKVKIISKAVGKHDGTIKLFKNSDSTGIYADGESITVECISLSKLLKQSKQNIHLLEINIEGAEFHVLPDLINSGAIAMVKCLLIQFHNLDASHENQRASIRASLRLTHKEVYCYDWVWELWQKKDEN